MGLVSGIQEILQKSSTSMLDTDRTHDLRVIPLPDSSLHIEVDEENTKIRKIKYVV